MDDKIAHIRKDNKMECGINKLTVTHTSLSILAFRLASRTIRTSSTSRSLGANKLHVLLGSGLRLSLTGRILLRCLLQAKGLFNVFTKDKKNRTSKEVLPVLSSCEISSQGLLGGLGSSGDVCIAAGAATGAFISLFCSASGILIRCSSSSNRTTVCAR